MKYCTECRTEYEEGVERCADCDIPLAGEDEWKEHLGKEAEESRALGEMVRLRILEGPIEKEVIVDALTREGIPHLVREFHDTVFDGLYVSSLGWGEIEVPEADMERAKALADTVLQAAAAAGEGAAGEEGALSADEEGEEDEDKDEGGGKP